MSAGSEKSADSKELLRQIETARSALFDAAREAAVARQKKRAAMTARERIDHLADRGSFREMGALVQEEDPSVATPADGVIVGSLRIGGRAAMVVAQDFTALGGSTGKIGSRKIGRAARLAGSHGIPLVFLLDGGGHRIQEGQASRHFADVHTNLFEISRMSGWIPIAAAMLGAGFAAATNYAALADFVVMVRGQSTMGLAGPALVKAATGEDVSAEALGGALTQVDENGLADLGVESEEAAIDAIKQFLAFLPPNAGEVAPRCLDFEPAEEAPERLLELVPANTRRAYDMRAVVRILADRGSVYELKPTFAANVITAFARLAGRPVGIVANQPLRLGGMLNAAACEKAAHFVSLCDAFGLPLIYLVDLPGFSVGPSAERTMLGRRSAKMIHELAHATVPRMSVVLRKGYGLGYLAMCGGRSFDADAAFAWPTAEICAMSIEGSVDVAYRKDYERADDPAARRAGLIAEMRGRVSALAAAQGFGLDDIIDPRETRQRLIEVLEQVPSRRTFPSYAKKRSIAPI